MLHESAAPNPGNLRFVEGSPRGFERVAVAYGYSSEPFDIGEVDSFDENDDIGEEVSRTNYDAVPKRDIEVKTDWRDRVTDRSLRLQRQSRYIEAHERLPRDRANSRYGNR